MPFGPASASGGNTAMAQETICGALMLLSCLPGLAEFRTCSGGGPIFLQGVSLAENPPQECCCPELLGL